MRNVLKRMKNQFSEFCDHLFLRYGRFCTQIQTVFYVSYVFMFHENIALFLHLSCIQAYVYRRHVYRRHVQQLISWTSTFFRFFFLHCISLLFQRLCKGNVSLIGLHFCIFLLLLHLFNRNSLTGLILLRNSLAGFVYFSSKLNFF